MGRHRGQGARNGVLNPMLLDVRACVRACVFLLCVSGAVSFALYLLQPVVPTGDLFLVFEVSGR